MPAPQGSKSFKGISKAGHAILAESSKAVKPWRQDVFIAAHEEMGKEHSGVELPLFRGPISITMVFTLPRPKSAPKSRLYPDRKPDLSKLVRSTEDALTNAGVIEDDARIVHLIAKKGFPLTGSEMLDSPGAVIEIRTL